MAITTAQYPSTYSPAYSPQWFRSSSNQIAQPNFSYRVVITDLLSGVSAYEYPPARPDNNELWINVQGYVEPFMKQIIPQGNFGWTKNEHAFRKIKVNIGERYEVASVLTEFPGSDYDYYVWNGVLNFRQYPTYSENNYMYDNTVTANYLSNDKGIGYIYQSSASGFYINERKTYKDRSSYLYVANKYGYNSGTDIEKITIYGYNGNTLISTTEVTNPLYNTNDYTKYYSFIDVGYRGLANMPVGQCSGTYPIPVANMTHYEIYDTSSNLPTSTPPAAEYIYPIVKYKIDCESKFDVITVHYLAKLGQFETFNFSKVSERNSSSQKTSYGKYPFDLYSGVITYPEYEGIDKVLSVEERQTIKVTSDWLTESQVRSLKELFTSPLVYIDLGDSWTSVKMVNNSYVEKRKYNNKLISVQFELENNFTNSSQRG